MPGFKVTAVWPPEHPHDARIEAEEEAAFAIMEDEKIPSHGRFNFSVADVDVRWAAGSPTAMNWGLSQEQLA